MYQKSGNERTFIGVQKCGLRLEQLESIDCGRKINALTAGKSLLPCKEFSSSVVTFRDRNQTFPFFPPIFSNYSIFLNYFLPVDDRDAEVDDVELEELEDGAVFWPGTR